MTMNWRVLPMNGVVVLGPPPAEFVRFGSASAANRATQPVPASWPCIPSD